MAKKFVKVTGLNKVFDVSTDNATLDTAKLKASVSTNANEYSILYITATAADEVYGYKAGTTYTWSRGMLIGNNTVSLIDGSNGISGAASAEEVYNTFSDMMVSFQELGQYINEARTTVLDSSSDNKAYLLGHEEQDTTADTLSNSSVYMQNGKLYSDDKEVLTDHKYRPISVNGAAKITSDSSDVLDISAGTNISLEYTTDKKLVISSTSTETSHDVSITGDVEAPQISISGTATAFNTTIKNGTVTLDKLADSVKNGEVESGESNLVTGGTVYDAIQNQVGAAVQYLGTVSSVADLLGKTTAGYGDFARATAAFDMNDSSVHVGDMIILDASSKTAYATEANWNIVHGETDSWREVKVNGTQKIASNNSQALDVSAGSNISLNYTNNKLVIAATNTDEKTTETGHYTPSTKKTTYGDSNDFSANVISKIAVDSKGHIISDLVATKNIDAFIGGENILRCSAKPRFTTENHENSWNFGEYVNITLDGTFTDHTYDTYKLACPANGSRELVDAIYINNNNGGICQTISADYFNTFIDEFVNRFDGHNDKEESYIPITFSFYCKTFDGTTSITYIPCLNIDSDFHEQTAYIGNTWRKVSMTGFYKLPLLKELANWIGLGYVQNNTTKVLLVACPMVTFGRYDVDWKENPLDSKSDIVGIGNLLRNSQFNYESGNVDYYYYIEDPTTFELKDLLKNACEFEHNNAMPGIESLESSDIYSAVLGIESSITKGFIYRETSDLFSTISTHSGLMDYNGNPNTKIPVSMSIWVYSLSSDISVTLMPVVFSNTNLFAPVTYTTVKAETWTRLTRTIYISANQTAAAGKVLLGGILAKSNSNATSDVKFALPMVTFGSTPSTWFPSAYDIFNEINSVSSSASSALSTAKAAQTTANSASSIASTANSTANSALTTANNKVSKSGDTMTGDLNMSGNGIYDANVIETDVLQTYTHNSINFNCVADVAAYGFGNGETSYTSSQLMQGDGNPRTIETTLTDSDNIPTSSAVKKLKVGGRNLLRGTKDITVSGTTGGYWYLSKFRTSGTGSYETVSYTDGQLPIPGVTKTIKLTCATSSSQFGIAQDKYKQTGASSTLTDNVFNIGDTLCLSYWVKPSAAGVKCLIQPLWDCATNTNDGVGNKAFTLVAGWQRIYYSGTLTSTNTLANGFDIGYIYCQTAGASIEVCCPKLEFGEIPTDWTPALEDVGCTTDIIDTTGTYTYTDEDGSSYTVPDIKMTGRLSLFSPKKDGTSGGVIQFANYNGSYCYIGQGTIINKKFAPYDSETLCIGAPIINFIGLNNYPNINFSNGTSYYGAHLRNMDKYSVGSATATAYTWTPSTFTTNYGSSNFQYLFGHTATSLTVTIGTSTYFNNNIQYLLIQQTTNTCNITLSGTNVKTKGNITSFTVAAGQSIEFSCLYVNGYNYVTYTIFG